MNKLNFNKELFNEFADSYQKFEVNPSKYWNEYINMVLDEIDKDGLNGFGSVYNLTRGFGDAMSYPKRPKIRSLLKLPFLFKPVEKFLANRNQNKKSKTVFASSKDFFTQIKDRFFYNQKLVPYNFLNSLKFENGVHIRMLDQYL